MQNWKMTCTDGFTKTLQANTKEEAVKMAMSDPEVMAHMKDKHPEMAGKTPEELMKIAMDMTQPVEETSMPPSQPPTQPTQ